MLSVRNFKSLIMRLGIEAYARRGTLNLLHYNIWPCNSLLSFSHISGQTDEQMNRCMTYVLYDLC